MYQNLSPVSMRFYPLVPMSREVAEHKQPHTATDCINVWPGSFGAAALGQPGTLPRAVAIMILVAQQLYLI